MTIRKRTTFILGAGASYPYGYPLGTELLQQIIELKDNTDFLTKLDAAFPIPLAKSTKPTAEKEYQDLINSLERSGLLSIDAFMVAQPAMAEKSKFAIAYLLLKQEEENPNVNPIKGRGDWYRYLYNDWFSGATASTIKAILDNEINFITFNYDVSLERFFLNALESKFGQADAFTFLNSIPIKHVHGKIRRLPWEKGVTAADFLFHLGALKIREYSQGINYVHENKDDSSLDSTREILAKSENIVFLGFSYDPRNIELLRVNWHQTKTSFFGTFYNLEEGEVQKKFKEIGATNGVKFAKGESKADSLIFLKRISDKIT